MSAKPEPVNPFREPISLGKLMAELLVEMENPTAASRWRS